MNNGFAVLPGVFAVGEIENIAREVESNLIRRSRAGARHLLAVHSMAALARDSRLMSIAAEALGGEPIPFGATLFDKSLATNWLVAWHQDTALPLRERRDAEGWGAWSIKGGITYAHAPTSALSQVIALRVHLDSSTVDNGPLRVLPGTHRLGVLTDEQIHVVASEKEPVTCTVDRGGVLVMRPLLVHASSKAATDAPRRVLHLEYASTSDFEFGIRLHLAQA